MGIRSATLQTPLRILCWAIAIVSLFFLVTIARQHFRELPKIEWSASALLAAGAAILAYVATIGVWAAAWWRLLAAVGQDTSFVAAVRILGVSQIGKYAPGKVVHHVGRLALAQAEGLDAGTVLATIIVETALAVAAAAICAAVMLAFSGQFAPYVPAGEYLVLVALAGALVPLAIPAVLRRWGCRLTRSERLSEIARVRFGTLSVNLAAHAINMIVQGAILIVLARGVFGLPFANLPLAIASFSVAWLAGFAVPLVPAGVGVREAVLSTAIAFELGPAAGLAVAAAHRAVTLGGDGIAFAIAVALRPRSR